MLPILNQSLWRDEAFSVLLSEKSPLQIIQLTMRDTSPPFYYLILHYWMIVFGNSEVAVRGLAFLFHILTVFVVFLIAQKLIKSPLAQILITLVTLLNPFLLQYAFEARPYSMLAFLTTLAVYFLIQRKNLAASIVLALGILTHNYGVFNFLAVAAWYLYTHRANLTKNKEEAFQLLILPVAAILLWGSVIWTQWTRVAGGFWIQQATSSIFLHSFEKYTQGDLSYAVQPMLYTITLILSFFAFSFWISKQRKEEQRNELLLLSFVALLPTVITYLISALFAPIYHERYLIATVPMLILLVGYSLFNLQVTNSKLRTVIIAFVSVYLVVLIQASEQIVATTTKPAINYAVSQVLVKAQDGDIIVPEQTLNFIETKYYVEQSGKNIPVYAYQPDGKIPFYIGAVLFDPQEIITQMPKGVRIWQIKPDGGYQLLNQ